MSSQFASELNLFSGGDAVMFRASVPRAGPLGLEGPAYVLAPYASSVEERTRAVSGLVQGLVETGAIPKTALRNELQVRAQRGHVCHCFRVSSKCSVVCLDENRGRCAITPGGVTKY